MDTIHLTRVETIKANGLSVGIFNDPDGNWYVARDKEPVFCFEAKDRAEAVDKARATVVMWREHLKEHQKRA